MKEWVHMRPVKSTCTRRWYGRSTQTSNRYQPNAIAPFVVFPFFFADFRRFIAFLLLRRSNVIFTVTEPPLNRKASILYYFSCRRENTVKSAVVALSFGHSYISNRNKSFLHNNFIKTRATCNITTDRTNYRIKLPEMWSLTLSPATRTHTHFSRIYFYTFNQFEFFFRFVLSSIVCWEPRQSVSVGGTFIVL